ncbi:MAG: MurR/RpiR family transcriptional regulator [Granulosicoccus sp.]|nr:MurR/RpiR family transcriptional regulator [Granulosicoccus sp.]
MLKTVKQNYASLSRSEKRVADVIVADPHSAVRASIQSLSSLAGVSEPTVIRFCRALGTDGFQEFKLLLAQNLATKDTYFYQDVSSDDDSRSLSNKIIDSAIASLVQIKGQLNYSAVADAIELYLSCSRVEFYGSGGSGVVAEDAQLKFFRLGKPAIAYSDSHIQHATAALLDDTVLVIAISASGQNKDLIHTLTIARESKAKIVAITAADSSIAKLADVTLTVDVAEDSDIFSPVKSRLAQIVLLDILAVGAGVKGGAKTVEKLEKASHAIDFKFAKKT